MARVTVYDYVDPLVPALSKMYKARVKGYFELGYTLVGLDPAYSSELLSADRYDVKLSKDLAEAKTEVLFFLSFAHESRLRHLLESTKAPLSVFVKDGFTLFDHPSIITTNSPQPNLILIDGRIVYYGGINPFMYGQREDTIMRIGDPSVAKELRASLVGNTE